MTGRAIVFLAIAIPAIILIPASYGRCKTIDRKEDPVGFYFDWGCLGLGILAAAFLLCMVVFCPRFYGL